MGDKVRVAIVGSGPAGLSAAARAAQLGMSHVLLEKTDHLSDTIYKYQKGKHVMATPSNLVLRSDLHFDAGKRETILDTWGKQTAEHAVNVKLNADVIEITGKAGDFQVRLKNGEAIAPRRWCWRSVRRATPTSCAARSARGRWSNTSSTIPANMSTST